MKPLASKEAPPMNPRRNAFVDAFVERDGH
jgi:hypothetical protein